jgi:serine/threonine protein kinase
MGTGRPVNRAKAEENNNTIRQQLLNIKGKSKKEHLRVLHTFKNIRRKRLNRKTSKSMAVACLCDSCMQGDKAFCLQTRAEHQSEPLNLAQIWQSQMDDQSGFLNALLHSAFKSLRLFDYVGDGAHGFVYRGSIVLPQPTDAQAQVSRSGTGEHGDRNIGVRGHVAVKHSVCGVYEAMEYVQEAMFASCLVHPNIALSLGCILMSGNERARRSIEPHLSSPGYWVDPSEMDDVPACCQSFDRLSGDTEDDACVDVFHIQEFCSMGTLRKAIDAGEIAGCKDALLTATDIAKGLIYLHNIGFIHGDISSNNIVRCAKESSVDDHRDFTAKIIDFGRARSRVCEFKVSESNSAMGTICYMAPEHVLHGTITTASDVYSFGTVLWEMCTGQFAWNGCLSAQIVYALTEKRGLRFPHNPVSQWPRSLWDSVADLGDWCLHVDPNTRPSMQQVLDILDDILSTTIV